MGKKQQRDTFRLVVATSLVTPVTRCVFLRVGIDSQTGDVWAYTKPVIALVHRTSCHYFAPAFASYSREVATHSEAVEAGWRFEERVTELTALAWDPEFAELQEEDVEEGENSFHSIVPCDWPDEQDAERLLPVIRWMLEQRISVDFRPRPDLDKIDLVIIRNGEVGQA